MGPGACAWLDGARLLEGKRLSVVDVADGDGEGVGSVGGLGRGGQREQAGNHELNLIFCSEAVAGDGGLDGERGVFGDGKAGGGGGEQSYSANVAETNGGTRVDGVEDFFDGDDFGMIELEDGDELGVDEGEAFGEQRFLWRADAAGGKGDEVRSAAGIGGVVVPLDDAVTGGLGSAVDAADTHKGTLKEKERIE